MANVDAGWSAASISGDVAWRAAESAPAAPGAAGDGAAGPGGPAGRPALPAAGPACEALLELLDFAAPQPDSATAARAVKTTSRNGTC